MRETKMVTKRKVLTFNTQFVAIGVGFQCCVLSLVIVNLQLQFMDASSFEDKYLLKIFVSLHFESKFSFEVIVLNFQTFHLLS